MNEALRSLSIAVCVGVFLCGIVAAQGGDGRSESPGKSNAPSSFVKRPKIRSPRVIPRQAVTRAKAGPAVPPTGRLSIVVNESASQIYLSTSSETVNSQPIYVTSGGQSLVVRMLPPGHYFLTVKKNGYFDERREVDLSGGDRRKLVVSMRPQFAVLSLKTNLPDAEIEIENAGKFNKPLKKYLIRPASYRVSLKRRGFVSQTVTADLRVPGREQSIYVVLQPLRIDSVLAQAGEKLAIGDLNGAADLANDVLFANSAHAKANLLYGLVELRRGSPSSTSYFLKAIRGGETIALPVKIMYGDEFLDAELLLNREAIAVQSRSHVELNFKIRRPQLETLQRAIDGNLMTFISVKGQSDFYGRIIHPDLKIFATSSQLNPSSKVVSCPGANTGSSCSSEIDALFTVLAGWRSFQEAAVNRSE